MTKRRERKKIKEQMAAMCKKRKMMRSRFQPFSLRRMNLSKRCLERNCPSVLKRHNVFDNLNFFRLAEKIVNFCCFFVYF